MATGAKAGKTCRRVPEFPGVTMVIDTMVANCGRHDLWQAPLAEWEGAKLGAADLPPGFQLIEVSPSATTGPT